MTNSEINFDFHLQKLYILNFHLYNVTDTYVFNAKLNKHIYFSQYYSLTLRFNENDQLICVQNSLHRHRYIYISHVPYVCVLNSRTKNCFI